MQWLAEISVRRAVFASVLMLTLVVVGIAGYQNLGVDAFPKISFPVISVVSRLDGAAPEEIETQVTQKLEEAVNTISGIDELRSISSEGVSQLFITFTLETDIDVAAQDVRDHINTAIPLLPTDVKQPIVQKLDPDAAPILYLSVTSPGESIRDISEFADKKIKRDLENIAGVGQVSIVGSRKRQINSWLNNASLQAYNMTALDVQRAIASQNMSAPGGRLETGPRNLSLRINGRVDSPKALGALILKNQDNHAIRLSDVARVEDGSEEEQTAAILDGQTTLVLSIRKQSGQNTVAVVEKIKDRLDDIKKNLPDGYKIDVVRDNSRTIQTQVDAVKEHLILGSFFAAMVVLFFLGNIYSTFIAAVAIPISIIGTFALMAYQGFTLNIITLLALALAVGIVIDDAIVVLENIFRFVQEKKMKPFPAAIAATKDIGLAVLATTLSLIAVFLPVAFMPGIVGRFLNSFGLTMAFAIGVSLLVSFTLTPMLAARLIQPLDLSKPYKKNFLEKSVDKIYLPIEHFYMTILTWSMQHRGFIVFLCLLTLGSCVPLAKIVKKGFLPENDEANFEINIRAPEGTSLQTTAIIAERLATATRALPGVIHTLTTIGDNEQKTANQAKIYVKLSDPGDRLESQAMLANRVRMEIISKQPQELRIDVSDVSAFNSGNSSKTVQYNITGPSLEKLADIGEKIVKALKQVPGAADVDSNLVLGKPEVGIYILREKAAALGVDVSDIANTLKVLMGGYKVSTYEEGGEDYDIYLRADSSFRQDMEQLKHINVPSKQLPAVQLQQVVSFEENPGPSEINRVNRRRQVLISCNVLPGFGEGGIQASLEKIIDDLHLPSTFQAAPTGRSKEMGRAGKAFVSAFALSFIFMYLILAAQFESWLHPITILICLPLTVPFALLSLILFGQALSIQSALGLLVLFGVVKKNSILQVDHTNNLRAEGMPRLQAILRANQDRLRPILMTTISFVAGMIPLITSTGIGAGMNRATAGVVVGGQSFSLLLTLIATPVIYSLFDDASLWFKKIYAKLSPKSVNLDRGEKEIGMHETHH